MISEEQVTEALDAAAELDADGRWRFARDPGWPPASYSDESARGIVRACLILGVPVTNTMTGEAWCTAVSRIAEIEDRLDRYGVPR